MAITDKAKQYHEKMFPGYASKLLETDPEFIERFDNFAFESSKPRRSGRPHPLYDNPRHSYRLPRHRRVPCHGTGRYEFRREPVEIKEVVYQAVGYCGLGRVFPLLSAANEVLEANEVSLPLPSQVTQIGLAWQFAKGVASPIIGATKAKYFDNAAGTEHQAHG